MRTLLVAFLLISGFASAQITLSNADFADGGDTVRMSSTTDPTIDFLSTGANYTWDFSGLVAESQVLKNYFDLGGTSVLMQFLFGGFAPPAYQATNYTASNDLPLDQFGSFLPVNISEVNAVSKNTADSITSIGFSIVVDGNEVPFKSDTIETRYQFPANFGDVYSSRGYTNLDLNPIFDAIWIQYRQRSSNIDGWGQITTPLGSFDALRIRHAIQEQDSLYIGQFGTWIELPIPASNIYEWWTTGELEPILRITTSDFNGTETVTDIEYRDVYDPLLAGTSELISEVNVYPNPATNELKLDGFQIGSSYIIISAEGKLVQSGDVDISSQTISLEDFESGSYTLLVKNTDGTFAKSTFVKQ
ncbi:MAG: T9SS type A sorting domain-containing protein [Crocinitomicaceae bacterium]|nr:T9SS type A sorting domain-containing protein [Crocinitomicaceae bacterium]